jgi:hypothetical protein
MRLPAKALILLSAALLLTSCAAASLPEFDVEQTERDVVPAEISLEDIDAGTTRFVGEVEGTDLYLARGADDTLCLLQVRGGELDQAGCGSGLGLGVELDSGTRIESGTFRFPQDQIGDGERTKLSESVTVITYG